MAKHAPLQRAVPQTAVIVAICAVLVGITWLVFAQTIRHQFVTYDDPQYVYANPDVSAGISLPRICWAFTHTIAGNWHPLTTISHMLDCQLYGLKPAGHHFTNVFLHTTAVILLFLVPRAMTGTLWQSFFVAALFAIHPLHVESVAWISERKDVLSAVFFMLTLSAYARYVRAPSVTSYLLVFLLFALGLMSKPMLVTVPFVLLLLDYWPLGRITHVGLPKALGRQPASSSQWPVIRRLVAEKVPLFALSAFSSAVTLLTQFQSTRTMSQLPLSWRLNNAAVSYVAYIWQMFWPVRLAAFYPHPNDQLHLWQVILAIAFLIAVSLLAILWRNERSYIFTGWFWYVGMLVPVIGLVEAGEQARADRYTYLPQIGLYVLIVWGVADLANTWHLRREYLWLAATITIAVLSYRAAVQTSFWKNSERLWDHTLSVTSNNDFAHNNLGFLHLRRGELDKAISHFETGLKIRSGKSQTRYNLGTALVHVNLANALAREGRPEEAIVHYEQAVKLRPDYGDAYYKFGSVLFQQGRIDDAIAQWQKALAIQPNDAAGHTSLANAFLQKGWPDKAIVHYQKAVQIDPR